VVVIDLMRKTVASNVIIRPIGVVAKYSANSKICMNKRFHEGHHFILMAMEVHSAPKLDMESFIRECAHFFHDRQS
jgi:hypothetical protein